MTEKVFTVPKANIENQVCNELIKKAFFAAEKAYCPYSHYRVGAALLCKNGEIYSGCNIENASYGATNCAERTAIFKAVSNGETEFSAIAIVSQNDSGEPSTMPMPCGICRQVMSEFCDADFEIIVCNSENNIERFTLEELMPFTFRKD